MNEIQKEILTGLMLGDGCLEKHKNGINAALRITRTLGDKEYMMEHVAAFADYNIKYRESQILDKRTNKIYYQCFFRSSVNVEFTDWWIKWYPDGKKQIPLDLKLTPLILATWFADDGSIKVAKRIYDVKLATHGFSEQEVIFLQQLLFDTFNLSFKKYEDKSGKSPHWTLRLTNKRQVKQFVEIIDDVFPKGMERKSNIWRKNIVLLETKNYPSCKFCNSEKVSKNGSNNSIQKYICKKCNRQFT